MAPSSSNPLLRDRDVDFLLYELLDAPDLTALPAFAEHSRETFDLTLASARRLARERFYPAYRPMDAEPPVFENGAVRVHPKMHALYADMVALGVGSATRGYDVGGQQLPLVVSGLATAYLMAGNLSAYGYVGLTSGAAHLLESFGDENLKRAFMAPMLSGKWTGTMALTEPQAGSSLADVATRATLATDGTYRIRGAKIFISGGDHDLTENIVHLALARIEGAPAGIKGVSLFAIPKRRPDGHGGYVPNDVAVAGVIHKVGWRGLPSVVLDLGEHDDCHGWLVGEAHRGISYMFTMMNEARLMVGMNAVATASVAYHESLAYAESRPQGRRRGGSGAPVAIIEHADVRRMLLRQKAIVEGGLALLAIAAICSDRAAHAESAKERDRSALLLDLLTPVAKTFPAEKGFESNALAVQIHGGYGYSTEYPVESWLRDQKLNTIHEGTTGIQGLDLLGRKVVARDGAALHILKEEIDAAVIRANAAGLDRHAAALSNTLGLVLDLTVHLAGQGLAGDVDAMLLHSADYLDLFSTLLVSWAWLRMETVAIEALARRAAKISMAAGAHLETPLSNADEAFYRGKIAAARYFLETELPRVPHLATLCRDGESSYRDAEPAWF